ncbi:hypothetical protein ACFLW9_02480 [Chloroflexota bacterium]
MAPPTDLQECLAILTLRTLGSSQEDAASIVRRHKGLVSMVEHWFCNDLTYPQAAKVCEDIAIKSAINILLIPSEEIDNKTLVKAAQLKADDILRHFRKDYVEEAVKKVNSKPMELHLARLAQIADVLAYQVNKLVRYKHYDDIEAQGDVLGHLIFRRKSNGTIVPEELTKKCKHEKQIPIDQYLASCLYTHYEFQFGKQQFADWNQLSGVNVCHEIVDNLKFLAYGGLKSCPNCPMCREIKD